MQPSFNTANQNYYWFGSSDNAPYWQGFGIGQQPQSSRIRSLDVSRGRSEVSLTVLEKINYYRPTHPYSPPSPNETTWCGACNCSISISFYEKLFKHDFQLHNSSSRQSLPNILYQDRGSPGRYTSSLWYSPPPRLPSPGGPSSVFCGSFIFRVQS
jgi:hypothetical protein